MARATVHNLTEKERALVAETRPAARGALDEDALVELHTHVRRAGDKHVGLHRRAHGRRRRAGGSGRCCRCAAAVVYGRSPDADPDHRSARAVKQVIVPRSRQPQLGRVA